MHAHFSQSNVLSWNDNLNSTQTQYLSCPPNLEMKGQNEIKALHACNLLDQCFSFCAPWTGKPWDKCIIPFSSQLAYHKQDPCYTDRHKLMTSLMVTTEQCLANKAKRATAVLRELIQLNHRTANTSCSQFWRHHFAAVICLVSTNNLTTSAYSFFSSLKTFQSRIKTP